MFNIFVSSARAKCNRYNFAGNTRRPATRITDEDQTRYANSDRFPDREDSEAWRSLGNGQCLERYFESHTARYLCRRRSSTELRGVTFMANGRYDACGYPQGRRLACLAIPLLPRRAVGPEAQLEELRACSGTLAFGNIWKNTAPTRLLLLLT